MAVSLLGPNSIFKKRRFYIAFIVLTPLWMFLMWLLTPKRPLLVAIVDKTVLNTEAQEHSSLNWVLNNEKFVKGNFDLYNKSKDYFGFFPLKKQLYRIKGLEKFTYQQVENLSNTAQVAYLTDVYGIYKKEWFSAKSALDRSGILYGGMSAQDMSLLRKMKQKKKLIITEFNNMASPTSESLRREFEQTFAVEWTGWTGRYFHSFDTLENRELPRWLVENYKRNNNGKWPFKRDGIALVHNDERIIILENGKSLEEPYPFIKSDLLYQEKWNIPAKINYTFWFDITKTYSNINNVPCVYELPVNENGRKLLKRYNLDYKFPAVIEHYQKDYRFYYFCGDFCDNPVKMTSAYFKGVGFFKWMMYNRIDPLDRGKFFWQFYRPMLSTILNEYYIDMMKYKL